MKLKNALFYFAILLLSFWDGQGVYLHAQWNANPAINNPISTAIYSQMNPAIVSDGSGGAIITWTDYRNGNYDIYAQRIDVNGIVQWATNGVAICTSPNSQVFPCIVSDGSGGAIITWTDNRFQPSDIYVQRINAAGLVQWPTNGIAICTAVNEQEAPIIASDGAGGAIITWQDYRSGPHDIYAQRINAMGITQWVPDGIAICAAVNAQKKPTVVSDGSGGAIITWQDFRSGNYDIYAQHINTNGTVQWTVDGVAVCTATNIQDNPAIVSDGSGGAIITWRDLRSGVYHYVQRVSYSGSMLWATDGIIVSATLGGNALPTIISDGNGGAIITFSSGNNTYAQRIDASGAPQWTTNGIPICAAAGGQGNPIIASDGAGGAIIAWRDDRSMVSSHIYAQRVNAGGVVQWTTDGIAVSTAPGGNIFNATITTDGNGGAIIAWEDFRNGSDDDIYASRINSNGTLSIENQESNLHVLVYPNPTSGIININTETEILSIEIVDVHGRTIAYNLMSTTASQTKIELLNVTSGIYFALINTIEGTYRKKMVVN